MKKAGEILTEILALPTNERADLVLRILETLDDRPTEPDAEEAWALEIHRRVEALKSGRAKTVTAEQALTWVESRLDRKKK